MATNDEKKRQPAQPGISTPYGVTLPDMAGEAAAQSRPGGYQPKGFASGNVAEGRAPRPVRTITPRIITPTDPSSMRTRPPARNLDAGSTVGTAIHDFGAGLATLDAKLKAPARAAALSTAQNVANFGRTLVGNAPVNYDAQRAAPAAAPTAAAAPAAKPKPAGAKPEAAPKPPRPAGGQGAAPVAALPNAPQTGSYQTRDGRTVALPEGVSVAYGADGVPVFSDNPAGAQARQPAQTDPAVARVLASTPEFTPLPGGTPATQQSPEGARFIGPARGLSGREWAGDASRQADLRRSQLATDLRTLGRGSPTVRRGLMQEYVQEPQIGATAANESARNSTQLALAQMNNQARAAEGAADRQLTAAGQQLTAAEIAQRANGINSTITGDDGTGYVLDNSGRIRQLTGADGEAFRPAPTNKDGQITPKSQLDYLAKQREAILGAGMPLDAAQQQAALAQVDAQIQALLAGGKVQHAAPSLDEFMARARGANPGASDADLKRYYQQTYGQ